MKYYYISDVHLEFVAKHITDFIPATRSEGWRPSEATLIVAGDISPNVNQSVLFLSHATTYFKEVIFVLGNHDYLEHGLTGEENTKEVYKKALETLGNKHIHWLDNNHIVLDGVVFFGGTMWTNYYNRNAKTVSTCKRYMPELKVLSVDDIVEDNNRFKDALMNFIEGDSNKNIPTVCISHHLPNSLSIDPSYAMSPINGAFDANIDSKLINNFDVWLHGHTHTEVETNLSDTKILCNPGGYPGERKTYRNRFFTIDTRWRVAIMDAHNHSHVSEHSSFAESLMESQRMFEAGWSSEPTISCKSEIIMGTEEIKAW